MSETKGIKHLGRRMYMRQINTEAPEGETVFGRMQRLNKVLQSLPVGHNEVRRVVPMCVDAITEVCVNLTIPPPKSKVSG